MSCRPSRIDPRFLVRDSSTPQKLEDEILRMKYWETFTVPEALDYSVGLSAHWMSQFIQRQIKTCGDIVFFYIWIILVKLLKKSLSMFGSVCKLWTTGEKNSICWSLFPAVLQKNIYSIVYRQEHKHLAYRNQFR